MRRRPNHRILLLVVAAFAFVFVAPTASSTRSEEGGIFRISLSPTARLDYIDPALSFTQPGWALLDATCARLMTYPDKPAPTAYQLQREVAATYRHSNNYKRYTFTLRSGFRFSDGSPVHANADGTVPVTCSPRSGTHFRIGRTKVACEAVDTSANGVTSSFTVIVKRTR